jgi:LytS/YehU family sensor histidine kinase
VIAGCFIVINFLPSVLTGRYHKPPDYPGVENGEAFFRPVPGNGHPWPPPPESYGIFEPGPQLFLFIIVFLFSMGLATHDRWRMEEKERIKTELHFLKAQINPHFLFNAMNGIYSLTLEKSDRAPKAVLMLSSMMRYIYGRDRQDLVPLNEVLDYIDNYIHLQKLRFSKDITVEYEVVGDATGKMIAPMILVPLVENAFKHGVNAEASSEIKINILIADGRIQMHVFNHKVPVENRFESASGIGIANTRNRLALQYPDKHRLDVTDDPEQFTADLTIQWIS